MQRATELSQHCDLFIAIGSSLIVWPAAGFPVMAKNAGARLVIINREPTEQDEFADLVIQSEQAMAASKDQLALVLHPLLSASRGPDPGGGSGG